MMKLLSIRDGKEGQEENKPQTIPVPNDHDIDLDVELDVAWLC
jgi:hypothetical protein